MEQICQSAASKLGEVAYWIALHGRPRTMKTAGRQTAAAPTPKTTADKIADALCGATNNERGSLQSAEVPKQRAALFRLILFCQFLDVVAGGGSATVLRRRVVPLARTIVRRTNMRM